MKRLITCAGLAAIGAVSIQAQSGDPALGKPWSISATLRGFYDDNYSTAPSDPGPGSVKKEESWGVNIAPGVKYDFLREMTRLSASYKYDMRWFEARSSDEVDDSHMVDLSADHTFNDRVKVGVHDSFVYSSEPQIADPGGATYLRYGDATVFRNYGGTYVQFGLTEQLGTRVTYENANYDYVDDGPGSRSALLDRMEHGVTADLRYNLSETTVGMFGYKYGHVGYASSDTFLDPTWLAAGDPNPTGEFRNQDAHYGFVGADYSATSALKLMARVGFVHAEYPKANADSMTAPFADASLCYSYMEGSTATFGVKHDIRPTDVSMQVQGKDDVTISQEATTLHLSFHQKITPKLYGDLRGYWQSGSFNGGRYDGETDNFYNLDAGLAYSLTKNVAAEIGYAYDKLDSDIKYRGFDRNRFYFGINATY